MTDPSIDDLLLAEPDRHADDLDFMCAICAATTPDLTRMRRWEIVEWRHIAIERELRRRRAVSGT